MFVGKASRSYFKKVSSILLKWYRNLKIHFKIREFKISLFFDNSGGISKIGNLYFLCYSLCY